MTSLERYLYPSGSEIWLDSNGLLISSSGTLWHKKLIALDDAVSLPGGILLAEGGMGKTTFMEQFRDSLQDGAAHLFKLGEYVDDPVGFATDLDTRLPTATGAVGLTLILDGLDEAPGLAGVILRKIRQLPKSVSVWISSRDVSAIRSLQKERPDLEAYSLAPLTEANLRTLAAQAGVDGDTFLEAANRQSIVPICAKPLGCELAISVFKENGLVDVAQRDLWRLGIERLCDENPSSTRRLLEPSKFTLEEILSCSAWIFLCLVLTENRFVWSGEQSYCPTQSMGISDLASVKFSADLIKATLERGVFSPLGDGRIGHAHAIYRDYLAALGFCQFIPAEHWCSLLMNGQRDLVFPQRTGIAAWLAAYNTGFLAELSMAQPELLLASIDSIQNIGPDKLCIALLDRAERRSSLQRFNEFHSTDLSRLDCEETRNVITNCLLDKQSSKAAIELAISIIEACKYSSLAVLLADRVLDTNLSLNQRVDAGYVVYRLENTSASGRLKKLLPISPDDDPYDELRGVVLRACWPEYLSAPELVCHLIQPQKSNYGGAYSFFLSDELPKSLKLTLNEHDAPILLKWALQYINKHEAFDTLGRLARSVFSLCWNWSNVPAIAEILATGYIRALVEYRSPFREKYFEDEDSTLMLSKSVFLKNIQGRFAVLEHILLSSEVESHDIARIPFTDYPLYTNADLHQLLEWAISSPTKELTRQLAVCIHALLPRADVHAYSDQIEKLHGVRSDLIDDFQTLQTKLENAVKQSEQVSHKWEREQAAREAEQAKNQTRTDTNIKQALNKTDLNPESFVGLSSWLNSENGMLSLGPIDIQQTRGWGKLTETERAIMIDLAQRYIEEGRIDSTPPGEHRYAVPIALTTLRLLRPATYEDLNESVWGRCAVELLKGAFRENMPELQPHLDRLSKHFPRIADSALLNVVKQELSRGSISILGNWGSRFTNAQAEAVLAIADEADTGDHKRDLIVDALIKNGKQDIVRTYLDLLFKDGWQLPPAQEWHDLRKHAFQLSPASYIEQIIEALNSDRVWGREWIEYAVGSHDHGLLNAIVSCDVSCITAIYAWLDEEYPPSTYIDHTGVFSPNALDAIHMLKNHLVNHLSTSGKEGSFASLEALYQRLGYEWLRDYALEAKSAEAAQTAPLLSIENIKKLAEKKYAARRLVNTPEDLSEIVMLAIHDYEKYLQGDHSAIGNLWNMADPIRPRDEEYLSDDLKRYLDLRLKTGVIINREVQIKRKVFKGGAPGSRVDLLVHATPENGQTITLCIEVKCNWNASAKSALKEQLIDKYMAGGTSTVGILLLGWFACDSWDTDDDKLKKSTATWDDADTALADLKEQAERETLKGNLVSAFVLDCGLR